MTSIFAFPVSLCSVHLVAAASGMQGEGEGRRVPLSVFEKLGIGEGRFKRPHRPPPKSCSEREDKISGAAGMVFADKPYLFRSPAMKTINVIYQRAFDYCGKVSLSLVSSPASTVYFLLVPSKGSMEPTPPWGKGGGEGRKELTPICQERGKLPVAGKEAGGEGRRERREFKAVEKVSFSSLFPPDSLSSSSALLRASASFSLSVCLSDCRSLREKCSIRRCAYKDRGRGG